jgi:hypothetical protein
MMDLKGRRNYARAPLTSVRAHTRTHTHNHMCTVPDWLACGMPLGLPGFLSRLQQCRSTKVSQTRLWGAWGGRATRQLSVLCTGTKTEAAAAARASCTCFAASQSVWRARRLLSVGAAFMHTTTVRTASETSHYKVLDIPPGASSADIKKAYYRKAREHHPDSSAGRSRLIFAARAMFGGFQFPSPRLASISTLCPMLMSCGLVYRSGQLNDGGSPLSPSRGSL